MLRICLLFLLAINVTAIKAQHMAVSSQDQRMPLLIRTGGKIVYHLYVTDTLVNYTGKKAKGVAINGSIPAPTLYFTEGDSAEIHVHNLMHMETSIHWHGLILPNEQDGVPYLTTAPIKEHSTHIFRFPIVQQGTYWYHSHTMLQEQSGMYGAIVIQPKQYLPVNEEVVLLSDWTNENPNQVERSLHYATDWYAIKKGATQNYFQAIKEKKLGVKLGNEWKRMMAMDVSDVYYDALFTNGNMEEIKKKYKAGDKIRLRIINGSSSTYFWIGFGGGKMSVVANDGAAVEPVEVDRMIIGVSETYDVMVTLPDTGSYELRATAEDRTRATSMWLGEGEKFPAPVLPRLKYFEGMKMMNGMMNMDGSMNDMGMKMSLQQMDMNMVMYPEITDSNQQITTLNYAMLKAPHKTTLPPGPFRELKFELTGNMNRYVWTLNNKTISESDKILIKQGENIRIVLINNSMMRHPMHLHGHFFRTLNGQGEYSPLKTVLDIMPMETDTIEFHASEKYGDWYFHCHILYHMMSGMGRIFSYENTPPNLQIPDPKKALRKVYRDDRRFYLGAQIGLETNGSDGEIMYSNTRWMIQNEWRLGTNREQGYENEFHIGRLIGRNQWFMPYIGFDWRYRNHGEVEKNLFGQVNTKNQRGVVCFGFQYTMPMLIRADARVDTDGKIRVQFGREDMPLSSRLRLNFMWNTDKEYMTGFRYILTKYMSLSTHYDSDMGFGAGISITY
ncbi:multicopper oxidase domain-containing protein [Sediminibacterium sp.]|uniref:multicopper oxidase domain-containing protein n=1 Tax=Sediminibacterium sp. TaxID=1917865 RepID=UPI0025CCF77C|nr:multicopper oxidase domain-containing protein [Sediminibacterium sp.]